MRHRFTVVLLGVACAMVALTTHLASAGTADDARDARTGPTGASQTTAVTLASSQSAVDLFDRPFFTGRVIPAQGGVAVEIWQRMFNEPWKPMWAARTASDGTFEIKSTRVMIKTAYQARLPQAPSTTSNVVTVNTRPWLSISPVRIDQSTAFLVGAQIGSRSFSLNGKFALVQRAIGAGRWVTLRRVTLRRSTYPTRYVTAFFRLKLPRGPSYLRAFLPRSQVAPAYLPNASKAIQVKR